MFCFFNYFRLLTQILFFMHAVKRAFFFLVFLVFIWGCNKNNEDWMFCNGCDLSVWEGSYTGEGVYYNRLNGDNNQEKVPVAITIELLGGQSFKGTISSKDIVSFSFTGTKTDTDYYFNLAGSNQSVTLNLYKSSDKYKLTGTAKRYHIKNDTVVIDESLSYEVIKDSE